MQLSTSRRNFTPFKPWFHPLSVRWLTSQDPFAFGTYSILPCALMRKRQASPWPTTGFPLKSSIVTLSRALQPFYNIKQRISENPGRVDSAPCRVLEWSFRFHTFPCRVRRQRGSPGPARVDPAPLCGLQRSTRYRTDPHRSWCQRGGPGPARVNSAP